MTGAPVLPVSISLFTYKLRAAFPGSFIVESRNRGSENEI